MLVRYSAPILLATSLLFSGCKKADKTPSGAASGGSAASLPKEAPVAQTPPANPPPAAEPPAVTPPAADEAKAGGGAVVSADALEAIHLPKPKKLPENGNWLTPNPATPGNRLVNYSDGKSYWLTVHFADCNAPEAKNLPEGRRGEYKYCYEQPTGKVKDYASYCTGNEVRAVKAGHLMVNAMRGAQAPEGYGGADLEEFLGSVDLAALAKL